MHAARVCWTQSFGRETANMCRTCCCPPAVDYLRCRHPKKASMKACADILTRITLKWNGLQLVCRDAGARRSRGSSTGGNLVRCNLRRERSQSHGKIGSC